MRIAKIIVQLRDGLVFERQRFRQLAEDGFEVGHQFHREDGIDPVLLQRRLRPQSGDRDLQQLRELLTEVFERFFPKRIVDPGELRRCCDAGRYGPTHGTRCFQQRLHRRQFAFHHQQAFAGQRETAVYRPHRDGSGQRPHAGVVLQPFAGRYVQGHSAVQPQRPIHRQRVAAAFALCRQAIAVRCERVHERVRSGVIDLPDDAPAGRERRTQQHEVQRQIPRRAIEIDQTGDLRCQHRREFGRRLAQDETIAGDARAVEDAIRRLSLRLQSRHEGIDGLRVGHVQRDIFDLMLRRRQRIKRFLHFRHKR